MAATQLPCRRRKNITMIELPLDVIFSNILPRLPAKSVLKYLSVSKQWYSFLKSPNFVNMHLNYVINDDHQNHHKLLVLYKYGIYSFNNRDCETHKPGVPRRRPLPFEVSSRDVKMKSSCNGLVLIALEEKKSGNRDLILWNPLTGDYKTLSKIECYNAKFELYYNSSKKDYRILLLTFRKDVCIYSLKSDSWRRINSEDAF
ncbi:F-box/kelch-repeat protein-like protein [Tanacetum coccineum]